VTVLEALQYVAGALAERPGNSLAVLDQPVDQIGKEDT
jgi:hypothetical protein